ncbi:MAG TPA: hypothetical protein PK874_09890 [Desulfobacteraceae bacterium]|nr:hypothetical protein [Desulfobacteraceae bacterium]HPJ67677.1 hypothetical protein [Desulfobacteraceae bacterium]
MLPEGFNGIAAKYPGDQNIENDPNVVFVEKFQGITPLKISKTSALNRVFKRWDTVSGKDIMSFSSHAPAGSTDKCSLLITHTGGNSSGGGFYRQLLPGYDHLFVRFYVKFDRACAPMGHFISCLGGYNPPTPWPQGGAGARPDGSKRFTTQVDTYGKDWQWDFYTYWQGMHAHGDGRYWGTPFQVKGSKPPVERGKWTCVELMVKMNRPIDASNGEQAFWIDGRLWRSGGQVVSHIGPGFPKGRWTGGWWRPDVKCTQSFEGFKWRNTEDLSINFIWLGPYMPRVSPGYVSKIWLDNVVVAKRYIGPIEPMKQ